MINFSTGGSVFNDCPKYWEHWLPDKHRGTTPWVCTSNEHKVKAILWINIINLVINAIIFILSCHKEETLEEKIYSKGSGFFKFY